MQQLMHRWINSKTISLLNFDLTLIDQIIDPLDGLAILSFKSFNAISTRFDIPENFDKSGPSILHNAGT